MEKRYPRTVLATACIPWTEGFKVDEPAFRKEIAMLNQGGIKHVYLFGTAGEGYAMDTGLYKQVVSIFLDEMGKTPGTVPIVGIISLSMPEILSRIELGLELGARDFQISFPSWGAVTPEEGVSFLITICSRYPQARFMHYNNGMRSKTRLAMKHYVELSKAAENMVAVKNTGVGLYDLLDFHSEELPIRFFNLEMAYGFASMMGESSLLISYLNLSLKKAWEYFDVGVKRDMDGILRLHQEIGVVHRAMSLVPGGKIDGSYDKLFVKAHIPEFSQRMLPPYTGVPDEAFNAFMVEIRANLPDWK